MVYPAHLADYKGAQNAYSEYEMDLMDFSACTHLREMSGHYHTKKLILPPRCEKLLNVNIDTPFLELPNSMIEISGTVNNCEEII